MGEVCVNEEDGEYQYVCDECGEVFEQNNYGCYGCIYLIDDRELPNKIIGVWCDMNCMAEWLEKHSRELFPRL